MIESSSREEDIKACGGDFVCKFRDERSSLNKDGRHEFVEAKFHGHSRANVEVTLPCEIVFGAKEGDNEERGEEVVPNHAPGEIRKELGVGRISNLEEKKDQ